MKNACFDCKTEKEMLYSTPNYQKDAYSAAVCSDCFKKRRGEYPEEINKQT